MVVESGEEQPEESTAKKLSTDTKACRVLDRRLLEMSCREFLYGLQYDKFHEAEARRVEQHERKPAL